MGMGSPFNCLQADDSSSFLKEVKMGATFSPSPYSCNCIKVIEKANNLLKKTKGDFFNKESELLNGLRERFEKGRFNLAVLGQFKRGKSTLLNALIGFDILPSSVVPLTAIPTFLMDGDNYAVKVVFDSEEKERFISLKNVEDLKSVLSDFVTEEGNPENVKRVSEVIAYIPENKILKNKVVLIDTPGIGSTYTHNTEATLNFLPQCDAALFVVSADPPITEVELEFLKGVFEKVPRLFFVLNKIDYLDEFEIEEVSNFLKKHLIEIGIPEDYVIFPVSAKKGLKAKLKNDSDLYKNSGIDKIEKHLVDFLAREKSKALTDAIAIKARNILNNVLLNIELEIKSLEMPLDVVEKKKALFEEKIGELENEKQSTIDILAGDSKRVHSQLEEYSVDLRNTAFSYFSGILEEYIAMAGKSGKLNEKEIVKRLAEEIPVFFEKKMGEATDIFSKKVSHLLEKHQKKANQIIDSIKKIAGDLFDVAVKEIEEVRYFEIVNEPYWVLHKWETTFNPIPPVVVDRMIPPALRNKRIIKRVKQRVRSLVVSNVENLRWSIFQSIDRSFRQFQRLLEENFDNTLAATYGAVKSSIIKKKELGEKVEEELKRIKNVKREIDSLINDISSYLDGN